MLVESGSEKTEVDFAADARLFPTEQGPGYQLLSAEELAVDKLLAVFGRAEARDFVDLMAVESRFGLDRLFQLAAEKDRGFTPDAFAAMTHRFSRLDRSEFPIDDESFARLEGVVRSWREQALDRVRDVNRGAEPDVGIDL